MASGQEHLRLGNGMAFVKGRLRRLPPSDEVWEADFMRRFGRAAEEEGGGGEWRERRMTIMTLVTHFPDHLSGDVICRLRVAGSVVCGFVLRDNGFKQAGNPEGSSPKWMGL